MLGTGNCDPFGCPGFFGLGTYQQVYLSSAFPGAIDIEGLTFYEGQVTHNGGLPATGTYTLSFSYTSFDPGELNLASPSNNIGADNETFFTGSLPVLTPEGSGAWLVISGTPFVYNPADGNLLLTVTYSGSANPYNPLYLNTPQCGPETYCPSGTPVVSGSAYFGTAGNGGNYDGGLTTGFDYAPAVGTPEPASLILTLAGLGLVAFFYRRRSSRNTQ